MNEKEWKIMKKFKFWTNIWLLIQIILITNRSEIQSTNQVYTYNLQGLQTVLDLKLQLER